MEAGSHADLIAANVDRSAEQVNSFFTIDAAANYLKSVGITTLTVDICDSVTHVNLDLQIYRFNLTSARLDGDDSEEHASYPEAD